MATITAGAVDFVLKDNLTRLAPAVRRALESAELRRMQRNAAEQARLSEFAVDHASQAIVYVSEAGVIVYANRAAGRLAGIAPEAAIGEEVWTWYPHLSREDWSGLWHAATEGPVEDVDALLKRADGSERAVSVTLDHVERDEGDFVIAYARDVTESKRAQADLSFTQFAVERVGDPVYWIEAQGAFKYANPAACESLGYGLDELRTMTMHDIDPKFSPHWSQHISALKEAGSRTFETHHRRKDGTLMPVEVTAAYLEYDGAAYDVGFARDITERKRAEEALAASEKRFRGYFEQSLIGAAVTSPGKGFVDINQAFLELIGYSREELAEKSWAELTHPDDLAADVAQFDRVQAGEIDGYRLEKRFIRKDGEAVYVDMSVRAVRDDQGALEYFLALVTDVTERKRAEETLAHSRDLLDYVVEHASSAIAILDRDLKYVYVSQRYRHEYGIGEQNFIGRHQYDVLPDLPQKWRDAHQRALAGEVCRADRDQWDRTDGTVDWTRWECRPWYEADGTVGGIIVYTEVITDRVLAEEALRESERRFTTFATYVPATAVDPATATALPVRQPATGGRPGRPRERRVPRQDTGGVVGRGHRHRRPSHVPARPRRRGRGRHRALARQGQLRLLPLAGLLARRRGGRRHAGRPDVRRDRAARRARRGAPPGRAARSHRRGFRSRHEPDRRDAGPLHGGP